MTEDSSTLSRSRGARRPKALVSLAWLAALGLVACGSAGSGSTLPAGERGGAGGAYAGGGAPPLTAGGRNPSGGSTSGGGITGAAGGIGVTGNGGAAGGAAVSNGGNSSGISFDWPETVPGAAKPCQAGHYVGTFECLYQPAGTPDGSTGGLPIAGPIDFKLTQSQNGEFLDVSGGTLDGLALLVIHFKAEISGRLDCGTGVFGGTLVNGSYAIDPFPAGGTFIGPMVGMSTSGPPCTGTCLGGSWALHETGATGTSHIGTCAGTWTATFQP